MRKIIFVVLLIVLVAVVAQFWEQVMEYLFWLLGLSAAGFGATKGAEKLQEIQEKEKELDRDAEDRRKKAEALAKEDEEQKEKVEDWRERKNRWKSRGSMMLVLCMLLVAATPAWAGADLYSDLTREELIEALIEAEELLDEADRRLAREEELKEQYKALYLEAEEDLRVAREFSGQKDEIIAGQRREIEFLQYRLDRRNQAWGLTGGVVVTGQAANWTLGVSRRRGSLSWTLGVAGGDSSGVTGGVTWWLPSIKR